MENSNIPTVAIVIGLFDSNFLNELSKHVSIKRDLNETVADLFIVDGTKDVLNDLEICRRISHQIPDAKFLLISDQHKFSKYSNQFSHIPNISYLLESSVNELLGLALSKILEGNCFRDPNLM